MNYYTGGRYLSTMVVEMMTFNQLFLQLDENRLLNITNHIITY